MDTLIDLYLESHPSQALDLLTELCAQPSIAAQNVGMSQCADLVQSMLDDAGLSTQQLVVEGAPNAVYGELCGAGSFTVLLYNHYDVQPADPLDLWQSEPFQPTARDGNLYARGVSDNKGEIIARLVAIKALRDSLGRLPITIRWIIEGEEEVGSPHFGALAERYADLLRADGCLWEGSFFDTQDRPGIALGSKGMLYVQFEVRGTGCDAHSGKASILPSAAWRLVGALSSLRSPDGRARIPGFYDDVLPPTEAQLRALAEQTDMEEEMRQGFGTSAFLNGLTGIPLRERLAFSPTSNIAGIVSGYTGEGVKTVLPARAMAKMDFRLVPNQDPDDIFAKLQAYLACQGFDDISVSKLGGAEPVVTPIEHPFAKRVIAISEAFAGKPPSVTPIMAGTLPLLDDLRRHVGVPGLAAAGNPAYWGSGAHAPNEHIRVSDLGRAVRFNAFMFWELGKTRLR